MPFVIFVMYLFFIKIKIYEKNVLPTEQKGNLFSDEVQCMIGLGTFIILFYF